MVSFGWVTPSSTWTTIEYPQAFTISPVVYHECDGGEYYGTDTGVKNVTKTSFQTYQNIKQSWLAIGF